MTDERGKQSVNMQRFRSTPLYGIASLLPGLCLIAGTLAGGFWAWSGLFAITLLVVLADRSFLKPAAGPYFRTALPAAVAILHFLVLAGLLTALPDPGLRGAEKAALIAGAGLWFGQVANACAHELIHRQNRLLRRLGAAIYVSLLNGKHVSAHLLVHHVHAGTDLDPNSAKSGQGFWAFMRVALIAEFTAGWRAESLRRKPGRVHPYMFWVGGALLALLCAALLAGLIGVMTLIASASGRRCNCFCPTICSTTVCGAGCFLMESTRRTDHSTAGMRRRRGPVL